MSTDSAKKKVSFVLTYALQSFGLILLLAVLIRTFLLSSYVMSGAAMLPSVWPGDFLVGTKWHMSEPHRGDIVILRCPQMHERLCLKRVVALAGDRVEYQKGQLLVNGKPAGYRGLGGPFGQETVENSTWPIWPADSGLSKPPLVVPPQYVYLLNDKREDGEDSRSWGPLPVELLEARASRIWLSLDWFDHDGHVRPWPRVRWGRLLRSTN